MSAVLPNLGKMTREQMLQAMEELWAALSKNEGVMATPELHKAALDEAAGRYHTGAEIPILWEEAKHELLSSRQKNF